MSSLNDLHIHPKTRAAIIGFLTQNQHALLVSAPLGAGKQTLLGAVASSLGAGRPENQVVLGLDPKSIGIDEVKSIREALKLKTHKDHKTAVVLHNAEKLTKEAQNSLLKLLEEPPANTIFIISTSDSSKVLPTVLSRVAHITIMKPTIEDTRSFLAAKGHKETDITSALAISGGWIGLASTLLDKTSTEVTDAIIEAKRILSLPVSEKLSLVDSLAKQKDTLALQLYGLERVLHSGLHAVRKSGKDMAMWHDKLSAVVEAQTGLRHNVSPRLVLTRLMLAL